MLPYKMTRIGTLPLTSVVAASLLLTVACGSDSDTELADPLRFEWRLDYSDFTSGAPEQLRDCANDINTNVSSVRIRATDPEGQQDGFDISFGCPEGVGSSVEVRDIEGGVFDIEVTAGASNEVLFLSQEEGVTLTEGELYAVTLRAAVGELRLAPELENSVDCSAEVGRISLEFFVVRDGVADPTPLTTRFVDDPCDGTAFAEQTIFDLPAIPEQDGASFTLARYLVRADASDPAENRVGCFELERDVAPGPAQASVLAPITLAACP